MDIMNIMDMDSCSAGGRIGWCHSMDFKDLLFFLLFRSFHVKFVLLIFDTCAWLKWNAAAEVIW